MWKSCQRNGRHVRCVLKVQMSSPFGSGTGVSDIPTICPKSLIWPQFIQLFCPPSVPRSYLNPSASIIARPFTSVAFIKFMFCDGSPFQAMISVQPSSLTDMAQAAFSPSSLPKSVTLYLVCATAALEQARAIVVTHGIQKFRNRLSVFMCSLFLRESRCAEMAGNLTQARLGAVRDRMELRADIDPQLHKSLLSDNGGSTRSSTFTTIPRHNRPAISDFKNEWRTNSFPGQSPSAWTGRFSNFSYSRGGRLRNSRTSTAKS